MTTTMHSQPEPLHIARASAALDAVLAGESDLMTQLAVAAALIILGDVHPPYPPLPEPEAPIAAEVGIAEALAELSRAAAAATSPQEAVRIGLAARHLHTVLTSP